MQELSLEEWDLSNLEKEKDRAMLPYIQKAIDLVLAEAADQKATEMVSSKLDDLASSRTGGGSREGVGVDEDVVVSAA